MSSTVASTAAPVRAPRISSLTGSTPFSASRAARRASAGVMPAARYRSSSVASAARSSSSSSRSTRDLRSRLRQKLATRDRSGMASVRLEDEPDRRHDPGPVFPLRGQLLQAGAGDPVVLRAPSLRRLAPLSLDEALLLEPVQRREEGAGLHHERAARDLLDAVRHAHSVARLELQGLEDQEVERALHEFRLLRHGGGS